MSDLQAENSSLDKAADFSDWFMHGLYVLANIVAIPLLFLSFFFPGFSLLADIAFGIAIGWNVVDSVGAWVLGFKDSWDKNRVNAAINLFSGTQLIIFTAIFLASKFTTLSFTLGVIGALGAGFGFAAAMWFAGWTEWNNAKARQKEIETANRDIASKTSEYENDDGNTQKANTHYSALFGLQKQKAENEILQLKHMTMAKTWGACGLFMATVTALTIPPVAVFTAVFAAVVSIGAFINEQRQVSRLKTELHTLTEQAKTLVQGDKATAEQNYEYGCNQLQQEVIKEKILAHERLRNMWGTAALSLSASVVAAIGIGIALTAATGGIGLLVIGVGVACACVASGVMRIVQKIHGDRLEAPKSKSVLHTISQIKYKESSRAQQPEADAVHKRREEAEARRLARERRRTDGGVVAHGWDANRGAGPSSESDDDRPSADDQRRPLLGRRGRRPRRNIID